MSRPTPHSPRKKPRQQRSTELVDSLLEATARVLTVSGLDSVTTNEIARVAGVSVGSLYQYFPNKQALAAALIERKVERDLDEMSTHLASALVGSLDEVLRALVDVFVSHHRRDGALIRTLLQLVDSVGQFDRVRAIAGQGRELLRRILEERSDEIRDVNLEIATFLVGRTLEETTHAALLERPELLEDPDFAEELFQMCWRYLRRPRE